jgi:hypothetical protein
MDKLDKIYINKLLDILINYQVKKYNIIYDDGNIHISLDKKMDKDIYKKIVISIDNININDFLEEKITEIIKKIYHI